MSLVVQDFKPSPITNSLYCMEQTQQTLSTLMGGCMAKGEAPQ